MLKYSESFLVNTLEGIIKEAEESIREEIRLSNSTHNNIVINWCNHHHLDNVFFTRQKSHNKKDNSKLSNKIVCLSCISLSVYLRMSFVCCPRSRKSFPSTFPPLRQDKCIKYNYIVEAMTMKLG